MASSRIAPPNTAVARGIVKRSVVRRSLEVRVRTYLLACKEYLREAVASPTTCSCPGSGRKWGSQPRCPYVFLDPACSPPPSSGCFPRNIRLARTTERTSIVDHTQSVRLVEQLVSRVPVPSPSRFESVDERQCGMLYKELLMRLPVAAGPT